MLICGICGCAYLPRGRWSQDWCGSCTDLNFAEAQELRLHDPSVDALREATHQHYEADCRAAWPPTPRQIEARRRIVARWRREAGEEA